MIEQEIESGEDMKSGHFIRIVDGKFMKCSIPESLPNGVAARDIKKGETILFNPSENTKDVMVKS